MKEFAVAIRWDGDRLPHEDALQLFAPLAGCQVERTVAVPGAAVITGGRAGEVGIGEEIVVDRERERLIVGDLRLDGRADLARKLGGSSEDTDLGLLARAVEQFGTETPTHLVGDFAFLVWDWKARHLWAARDPFGLRTLHYSRTSGGFSLATDVRSLAWARGRHLDPDQLDPHAIRSFLLHGRRPRGQTYFRRTSQVRPGYRLEANVRGERESRHWRPPADLRRPAHSEETFDEFRSLFLQAVSDRLQSRTPIAAHLSGGLDSASIVGAAHSLYEGTTSDRPPFVTVSALFPGLENDESDLIAASIKRIPRFESVTFDGRERNSADFEAPRLAGPGLHGAPGTRPWRDLDIASERGATALLVGVGGDEVGWSRGIFRDVVAGAHLSTLFREALAFGSWERMRRHLPDGVWGLFPAALRGAAQAVRARSRLPGWLTPDLARLPDPGTSDREDPSTFSSRTQEAIWRTLTAPAAFFELEPRIILGRERGVEIRAPYLDTRLANFVLSVPWQERLPGGDMRRLQRTAVRPFLPESVGGRLAKSMFGDARCQQVRLNLGQIQQLLRQRLWASAPFVDQDAARGELASCLAKDPEIRMPRLWLPVCRIAALEAWLRRVFAYDVARGHDV